MSKKSPPARPIRLQASDGGVHLEVRVQPRSARDRIRIDPDGRLKIYVTAPPAGGAANAAVCALLAKALDLPKSAVRIIRGHAARDKQIALVGITAQSVSGRVRAIADS